MRPVHSIAELESAYERCRSEAMQAFGNGDVYVEKLFPKARHIEVQVIGDGTGEVTHLWERECSLQRNRQKLVEIAPAPGLPAALRDRLIDAALRMARAVKLRSLATFEFLVEQEAKDEFRLRVHRGQSAPAGRAHRHGGSDRDRSRTHAARHRGRSHAGRTWIGRRARAPAAWHRDATARQRGNHVGRWHRSSRGRGAGRLRSARRPRRTRGHLRATGASASIRVSIRCSRR